MQRDKDVMKVTGVELLSVIHEVSNIPLVTEDRNKAITRITQLARQVLGSRVCTFVSIDIRNKTLTHTACAGFDERFENWMSGRVISMGSSSRGYFIDDQLLSKGEGGERYDLQKDGQGIVNPSVARRYGFNSLLSYAVKSEEDGLIGYLNHFSSSNSSFEEEERKLIEIFGRQALLTIERFDKLHALDHSLRTLNELSQSRVSDRPDDFFNQVSVKAAQLLDVPICIVWKLDKKQNKLRIIGSTPNVDREFKAIDLPLDFPGIKKHLESKRTGYVEDVREPHPKYYKHATEAAHRGWVSLLTAPMWSSESELVGMIDTYTTFVRHFKRWEQEFFAAFANQAAVSIEAKRKENIINGIQRAYGRSTNNAKPSSSQLHEVASLIVEESAKALGANVGFLHFLNKANNVLELTGWFGAPESNIADRFKRIKLGEGVIGEVGQSGEPHICPDASTQQEQYAHFAQDLNLLSLLCIPIKWGNAVIGTVGVASDKIGAFHKDQQELLEDIIDSMQGAIGRANLGENLLKLARASHEAKTLAELCPRLAGLTRDLIKEPVCVVWLLDKDRNGFSVGALLGPIGQDDRRQEMFISNETEGVAAFLKRRTPLFFTDAREVKTHPYRSLLKELEWLSMLAIPLIMKEQAIGVIEVYSYKERRDFSGWPTKLFESWATQVSIAIGNTMARERLEILGQLTRQMAETNKIENLLDLALEGGLKLVRSERGWISRLDPVTGALEIINHRGNPQTPLPLKAGEGITGEALEAQQPKLARDIRDWKSYVEYWPDTQSELAVPILLKNAEVRIGTSPDFRSKRIGVLNVESPMINGFSEEDQENLLALAQMTAIMIERLELDRKVRELTDVETNIVGVRGYEETIKIVMRGIKDTLGYDYVNISLVVPELDCIRTEYITGIDEGLEEEFKTLATHPLNSRDIQATIVESRDIEVPEPNDSRFDGAIYAKFGHQDFVRVFLPMIVLADNRVIGTVEAGYRRTKYREYIYEQDVQILQGFVTYAVQALESRNKVLMETICHDLRHSINGIRNNASFLKTRFTELDNEKIERKLQDVRMDSQTLFDQVDEVEYVLGGALPDSDPVYTIVMRDVVIKAINQLAPSLREGGFRLSDIEYKQEDIGKIKIYVDQHKLNQVVINLLTNSIKYSEDAPDQFKIRISVDLNSDVNNYIIKFKDWGIGIQKGLEEKIFERGYRAPEAVNKNVTGSGLGLTRARKIMKELDGNLILAERSKPTAFHLIIPKKLKENPYDSLH